MHMQRIRPVVRWEHQRQRTHRCQPVASTHPQSHWGKC